MRLWSVFAGRCPGASSTRGKLPSVLTRVSMIWVIEAICYSSHSLDFGSCIMVIAELALNGFRWNDICSVR